MSELLFESILKEKLRPGYKNAGLVDPTSGRSISKKKLKLIKKYGLEKYKKLNPRQRSAIRAGDPGTRFMSPEKFAERAKKLKAIYKGKGSKFGETPKVIDLSGPEELKQEYLDDFKKRLKYPKAGREYKAAVEKGEVLSNPQLAKKYDLGISEIERINNYFRKKVKNLKYKKGTPASGQELRQRRLRLNQPGTYISGKGKIQFHHIMPIGGEVDLTSKDVTFINKYVNASMQKYNNPLNRISDAISDNLRNYASTKDTDYLKRVDNLNTQAAQIVDKARKELPKQYRGLIGFNKITPVLDENATLINTTVERIGVDEAKTPGGKKGPKVKLSAMRSGTYTPSKFRKEAERVFKLLKPVAKVTGKVIKPLGIVSGITAATTAAKAGEVNPIDLLLAYGTADPQTATDARRMRQEPEFRKQQIAGLPAIQTEDFTSLRNGGIVAVKGVI
tara:strand:+ start:1286 stop:2629 length:1344 start_codon:yes stop_codon:yes gene_type:complete